LVPALFALVWWIYRGEGGPSGSWPRLVMGTLRFALLLVLVLILFRPTLTRERVQTEDSTILIIVDDSYSMGIKDRFADPGEAASLEKILGAPFTDETTRLDIVTALLERQDLAFLDQLREKGDVAVVAASNGVRRLSELSRIREDPGEEKPVFSASGLQLRGRVTRLGDSITDAVNDLRGESIAAVILISDGRDNGGAVDPEEAARRLGLREIPIYTIGVGNAEEPRNIKVFGLDIAEVVLEGDKVNVDFQIESKGYPGEQVRAEFQLVRDDGFVEQRVPYYPTLGEDEEVVTHRLEFQPKSPGRFIARIEVPPRDGELFVDDNIDEQAVTVLAQKIKVLYVEGPPRYDYRYLKNSLTRDPTMEAHILLLEADPEFIQESSPGLTPIKEFPRTREGLFEYDVVMLGDLHPDRLSRAQKEWLVEFVDDHGGGVIFLSGQWFMPQRYRGDPLEKLLPVELQDVETRGYDAGDLTEPFHVILTPEGLTHPVMQLVGDPKQNQRMWQWQGRSDVSLPGFYWYAKVKKLKKGAVALAVHESEEHFSYGPRPVFAFQYFGRGRTFISLTDDTWRLRKLVGNRWFYRFWGQAIRFVSAGRLLGSSKRFSVSTDQREYVLGARIKVLARTLGSDFKPTRDEEQTLEVERTDPPGEEKSVVQAVQNPARPEYFETTIEAREIGDHKISLLNREEAVASTLYRVVVPQMEYADPRMDRPRLERVARLSGGSYHRVGDATKVPPLIVTIEKEIPISEEREPLWDTRWVLLLFVGLLTVEWVLRKVFRLQ
ncbi:MAG TPA: VWA domain-containing protein, partial [Planctomycetes bacterium]|nr:VWA domain-containing protein [Planctomycetota bacterium]